MSVSNAQEKTNESDHLLSLISGISLDITSGAASSEQQRTLAADAVNAITNAGLWMTKLPRELGGVEADPVAQFRAIEAMTELDTSAGWCFMIGAASVGIPAAFLADSAIDKIFADGKIPRFASVGLPGGQAMPTDGGYKLSGRWPFASGVRHSEWIWCGSLVPTGAEPEFRMCTFRLSDAEVVDDWHVSGLKGTGSCDVVVDDLFIPTEFTWHPFADPPKRGGPLYRLGLPGILTNEHAAFASGAARRVLSEVIELSKVKKRGIPPAPLGDRGSFQLAVGRAKMELDAARAHAINVHQSAFNKVSSGAALTPSDQTELRASATYITEVALSVTSGMFRAAGASSLHSSSVIQRYYRDLVAAGQHFMVSDSAYESYGKACLGVEDVNPMS